MPNVREGERIRQRRKQFIVASSFQWRFSVVLVLVGLGVALVIGLIVYRILSGNVEVLIESNAITSTSALDFIDRQEILLWRTMAITFIGVSAVLLALGIYLSHKLAGPIYALTREMKRLAAGDYNATLVLRKHDEFQYLKNSYNELVAALQNHLQDDLLQMDGIMTALNHRLSELQTKGKLTELDAEGLMEVILSLRNFYNRKSRMLYAEEPQVTIENVVL
ncbi:MAG: hypothetical protein HY391_03915 [Deltaproteobacteria bacterium]|nr:hypothetical protein [Deltaproteobacteria bacterium]